MNEFWNWDLAFEALPRLLMSFLTVTLLVTVVSTAIAAVLGLVLAILRMSLPKPLAMILKFIIDFIRMTPIVVQLIFAYFAFTSITPLTIGIIIFGIHYATYMAEVYRAGIESVPKGQWEATTALSMSRTRTWVAVIIPQAVRATVPALGNYAISMFKETPFLLMIGVVEMVQAGLIFGGNNFKYIEAITLAGVIFLLASYPTSLLIGRLEKRLAFTH
ncbi:ectoine/hydroxyectoine ABC transporter permease subunit EhuD [Salinibacterium sp. dk2585]|uniref:ectoine/hydroxyectoine ABC transporter permease subunit EhuD n=1 Tax=unclassified Salinibacterium TaxID=2632331 RepID=UPI0011C24DB6|nr:MULTISPECIES: ectoine/hydroxyectoine ABC transporter permease subunit EhuD [unclassified Salinibacterium]QEE61066.1 ectoine/hydroxyectoine ABC transporter permease subunit EhuD [Salinibacterium sp. dk2585]TXK53008.1 ectoine/hydroxyectoine ABC transporter permease subunit EhuD [Salinibacterium sp. dk5596]